jgi:flagellar basal body P-ring formation protein FlgA
MKKATPKFDLSVLALCVAVTTFSLKADVTPTNTNAVGVASLAPAANLATPASRLLKDEELRTLLTDYLNRRHGATGAEWELSFTRDWAPVPVPDVPLRLEILEPSLDRISSSALLRFEIRAGRQIVGTWQMSVQAHCWREVVVAESKLQRGDPLREAPLARMRRDLLTLREPLLELPANPDFYEIAETVPSGNPLTARAFRLRPVVHRGQTVNAIMCDNALTISLKVEVMEDGAPGQLVRVRNLQSRRELRGKVQDERTISILL